jgi:hypothetical protein
MARHCIDTLAVAIYAVRAELQIKDSIGNINNPAIETYICVVRPSAVTVCLSSIDSITSERDKTLFWTSLYFYYSIVLRSNNDELLACSVVTASEY